MRSVREKAWVNRILRGDKRAGERLVTENYQRVYGVLRSLSGNREAAEDLTQQTFVRAWEGLAGFRGEARISTWLSRIAYREYLHWRRDRREFASLHDIPDLPDPKVISGLRTVQVARALELLGDDLRGTFLLFYEQELAIREIAVMLDIPAGTVKSRLFTARNRLREILMESDPAEFSCAPAALVIPGAEPIFATLEEKPS